MHPSPGGTEERGSSGPEEPHPPSRDAPATRTAATRVIRNSFWLIGQPLLMNVISLVATAYIARTLGRANYGRFVFALSFIAMFTPLTNLGLRFLAIRHLATAGKQDVSAYIGRIWLLRLTLALLGASLAAASVALMGRSPETRQVVYLASCIIALQAVTTTATDVFQAFENMRLVAQVQFVSGILLTVLSVVVLYAGLGLNGVMGAYVVGNVCGAALAVYYLFTRYTVPRFAIDLRFWRTSLGAAAPLFLPNFVREAGTRFGVVMLGGLVDQDAVGSYGAAGTLVERIAIIPDGVCSALFPTLAATYERSQAEAAALYRRFFRYFLIVALPIAVGATVLARPIIELIYGSRYERSPTVLVILVWGLFANFFVQLQGWSIAAIKQERKAFFAPILATAVYLPLCLALVPRLAEYGLAAASIGMAGVLSLRYRPIVRAHLTARSAKVGLVIRVLAANAIMAAAVFAARGLPALLSIPLGAAVYGVALVALGAVPLSEAAELLAAVRRRLGLGT